MENWIELASHAFSQLATYSVEDVQKIFNSVSNFFLAVVAVVALIRIRMIRLTLIELRGVPDQVKTVAQTLPQINEIAVRIRESAEEIRRLDILVHKIDEGMSGIAKIEERMSGIVKQVAILQAEVSSYNDTDKENSDNWSEVVKIRMHCVEGIESIIERSSISSKFAGMSRRRYDKILYKMQRNGLLTASHVNTLREIFRMHYRYRNQRPRNVTDEDLRKIQNLDAKLDTVFGRTAKTKEPKVILSGDYQNDRKNEQVNTGTEAVEWVDRAEN